MESYVMVIQYYNSITIYFTPEEIRNFEVIKAFDPGVINMYCGGSGVDKDGKEIINKLTSKKYYHDYGFNQATFQRNKIYKDNPTIWEVLNKMPSHTTVDIEEYEEYVKYNMLNVTELIKFHMDKKFFRKMKFTNYIKKQKKFEVSTFIYYKTYQFLIQYIYIYYIIQEICKEITGKSHRNEKKKVLIAFGNGANHRNSRIKGHKREPNKELEEKLSKWCKLLIIDEFRTSIVCNQCKLLSMEATKYKGKNGTIVSSSRILSCTNCKGLVTDKNGKVRERKIRDPIAIDSSKKSSSSSKMSSSSSSKMSSSSSKMSSSSSKKSSSSSKMSSSTNKGGITKSSDKVPYSVDRDVNAYRNILYVFLEELNGREKLAVFKRGIPPPYWGWWQQSVKLELTLMQVGDIYIYIIHIYIFFNIIKHFID